MTFLLADIRTQINISKRAQRHTRCSIRPVRRIQYSASDELTCAGLDVLGPRVVRVWVADISTSVEPSAAASTTTAFVRVFGGAALGTDFDELVWASCGCYYCCC